MRCRRCDQEVLEDRCYVHLGEMLCDDCYLEATHRLIACDPWAIRAARGAREYLGLKGTEGLTELQKAIYEFIKSRGKVTWKEVMEGLGLGPSEMETQFAILMHCELVGARKENDKIYLMPSSMTTEGS